MVRYLNLSAKSIKFKKFLWHSRYFAISLLFISQRAVKAWKVQNSLDKLGLSWAKLRNKLRLSFIEVVFRWGHPLLWSSSIEGLWYLVQRVSILLVKVNSNLLLNRAQNNCLVPFKPKLWYPLPILLHAIRYLKSVPNKVYFQTRKRISKWKFLVE